MKNQKFHFLKYCEWLYQGTVSAGVLFVLYGFLQDELVRANVFPETESILQIITVVVFAALILIHWSREKGYLIHVGLGLIAVYAVAGFLFTKYAENESLTIFWHYVGLESVCILVSVIVYAIWHSRLLKGLVILAQTVLCILLVFWEKPLPIWCVGILLTAVLLFLVELRNKEREEVLGLLPLFAVAVFVLCMMPRSEKPMDWSWVKNTYVSIRENLEMLTVDIGYITEGKNKFSLAGYGSDGELGGSVLDSNRIQLHITGSGTRNPLYLTGKVYEVYTGKGWQIMPNPMEEREQENILDALKKSIYEEKKEELVIACRMGVEYRFIRTSDFFHELNTTELYGNIPQFKENFPWTLKYTQRKDFEYQFRYLEVNENSEEIKALLRQQAWKENVIWEEAWAEREAFIYQNDTVLPENIPERVYELAHTIAAGEDTDYDRMVAFADYLAKYTYTKTPPECPDGWDFTDYFLFESKSGYCSYFATAMAVLGRCEGIPTRYVQGFRTEDTCKSSHSDVLITGASAHAWTEFYVEHVGWVRIDATPGFGDSPVNRWQPKETASTNQTEQKETEGSTLQGMAIGKPDLQEKPAQEPVLPENNYKKPAFRKGSPEWYVNLIKKSVMILLAGCILMVVLFVFRNWIRRRNYKKAGDLEKIQQQLRRILRLGKLCGVPREEGETLQTYQERIGGMLDTQVYTFSHANAVYEEIRFGEKTVLEEEMQRLEIYAEEVERNYLKERSFIEKFVYRVW